MNIQGTSLVFAALGGLVLLFIIAPLLNMYLNCSQEQLKDTIGDTEVKQSIWLTIWTSMAATLLFSIPAIPLAYLLARMQFPFRKLINGIINLPVVIPHSAAGIALLGVLSRGSLLGGAAEKVGLSFVGSPLGIMAAMAFVSIPFLINAARDGFAAVPTRLEKAAQNLGASPARVFFTISVPLAKRSILSGMILMWARGMSEFGAVLIIAYHPMITPVLLYEKFTSFGLSYARPIAVIFITISLILFVILRLLTRERENAGR
jgi:molybdate/tungstate transport system permease protein